MKGEREIAGLRCGEVLEQLSDYLDNSLDVSARAAVDAHLAACDVCERFGGRMSKVVKAIRTRLQPPDPVPEPLLRRLLASPDAEE